MARLAERPLFLVSTLFRYAGCGDSYTPGASTTVLRRSPRSNLDWYVWNGLVFGIEVPNRNSMSSSTLSASSASDMFFSCNTTSKSLVSASSRLRYASTGNLTDEWDVSASSSAATSSAIFARSSLASPICQVVRRL